MRREGTKPAYGGRSDGHPRPTPIPRTGMWEERPSAKPDYRLAAEAGVSRTLLEGSLRCEAVRQEKAISHGTDQTVYDRKGQTSRDIGITMGWNIDRPRELVQEIIGFGSLPDADKLAADQILQRIDSAMQSVGQRIEYARYHYHQAKDLQTLREQRIQESPSPHRARLTYGVDYPEDRIAAGAHIVACLQNTHALFDLFLFGAYHAIFISVGGKLLEARSVTWKNVGPMLASSPELAALHASLEALRKTADFGYLDALVNSSKHRAVIRTQHWIVVDSKYDEESAPRFNEFEFNGKTHPRREALPFTARAWEAVTRVVIDSGLELERVLGKRRGR